MMNNRIVKSAIMLMLSAVLVAFSVSPGFAAEDELEVNSQVTVKKGDKIKYDLYLSETTEDIWGFELRIFYDNEYLKLDTKSLKFPKFDSVIYNSKLEDKIAIAWTDISSPADFSSKSLFLSMQFDVLKGGKTDIAQFVTDMYGEDLKYLKSYKWTYNISVNGEEKVTDKTPIIDADEATLQNKQRGIINYLDGMGEENSPNKDNHEAMTGVMPTTRVVTEIQDVTKYVTVNNGEADSDSFTWIILIAIAGVVVAAGVAFVIIMKKR